jgi:hypothetical protein
MLTEKELLSLATPPINSIDQVIEPVKRAIERGFTGEYTFHCISKLTSISRGTLYRWEKDGTIKRKGNKLSIFNLYNALRLIENRKDK